MAGAIFKGDWLPAGREAAPQSRAASGPPVPFSPHPPPPFSHASAGLPDTLEKGMAIHSSILAWRIP